MSARGRGRGWLGAVAALLLGGSAVARAEAPRDRTWTAVDLAAGVNPAALRLQGGWFARRALPDGEGPLQRGRGRTVGIIAGTTPAYGQLGVELEAVPVAVFELRARLALTGFYGQLGALWRLPSRQAPFGDRELRDARARPGLGGALTLAAAPRVRLGRVVVRNELSATLLALSRERGWYYYPEETTVVAPRDAIVSDRLAVLGVVWERGPDARLLVGPVVDATQAVRSRVTRLRVGGLAALSLDGALGFLRRPRLALLAGVAPRERNRTGEPFAVVVLGGELGGAGDRPTGE